MKHLFIIICCLVAQIVSAQDNCHSVKSELAAFTYNATSYSGSNGGVWTGKYQWINEKKDDMPPHWELFMGNNIIKSASGKEKDIIHVYGFNKDEYRNYVKMKDWAGYEVKIEESYARIWVIIYKDKVSDESHHKICMKILEQISNTCHGNPSF